MITGSTTITHDYVFALFLILTSQTSQIMLISSRILIIFFVFEINQGIFNLFQDITAK